MYSSEALISTQHAAAVAAAAAIAVS